MKPEEESAQKYFLNQGYTNIIFEPKGNRPPDFLLNDKIAVEVRRLNQLENKEPIEKLQYKLLPKLNKTIHNYGSDDFDKSVWIDVQFFRPLKVNKKLFERVETVLQIHSKDMDQEKEYEPVPNLLLKIFPSQKRLNFKFNVASSMDGSHGGFVVHDIHESLKLILEEKDRKISSYKREFDTWWLALIGYIGYGLSEYDLNQLKETIDFPLRFEKIIFISPLTNSGVELTDSNL